MDTKNKPAVLKKLTNKFWDADEEKSFDEHNLPFHSHLTILIPMLGCLWNIMNDLVEIIEEKQSVRNESLKEHIAAPIFLIAMIVNIIRYKKKLFAYNKQIILFWSTAFLITIMIQNWTPNPKESNLVLAEFCTFLINGLSIQIIFSILSHSKINYFFTIPIKLGISIWLFFKISNLIAIDQSLSSFLPHFVYLGILIIYHFIITYWMERNAKNMFHLSQIKENYLANFKNLLLKTITSPTIIINQNLKKILFANDSAFQMLLKTENISSQTQIIYYDDIQNSLKKIITYSQVQATNSIEEPFIGKLDKERQVIFLENEEVKQFGKLVTSEGEIKQLEIYTMKCNWEGQVSAAICINDVSVYKESESFKDKILATVSHNLRTPLMSINAEIEQALENPLYENKTLSKLQIAHSSTQILISTINSMLDFSLLSRGSLKIEKNWCKLESLINPILKCFKLQAELKGLQFSFTSNLNLSTEVSIDSRRLIQILMKLISNAVKFTTVGFVKVSIELIPELSDNFRLQWQIEDSGAGIEQNKIDNLFKFAFMNQDHVQTNNLDNEIGGVNIGLYLCHELAKLLGPPDVWDSNKGISVTSELHKGTVFSFSVWIKKEEIREKAREQTLKKPFLNEITSEKKAENISFSEKSILIVDDDPFCINIVCSFAKAIGFSTIEKARNGKECLQVIEYYRNGTKKNFDVIVMDCDMPEMNGLEASEKITEMIKSGTIKYAPIMALTANISTADISTCKSSGMRFQLSKPVSKDQFREKMVEIFTPSKKRNSLIEFVENRNLADNILF